MVLMLFAPLRNSIFFSLLDRHYHLLSCLHYREGGEKTVKEYRAVQIVSGQDTVFITQVTKNATPLYV